MESLEKGKYYVTAAVFEFTRPMYSSMIFGLLPAACTIEGC